MQMDTAAWVLEPDFLGENVALPILRRVPSGQLLTWISVSYLPSGAKNTFY